MNNSKAYCIPLAAHRHLAYASYKSATASTQASSACHTAKMMHGPSLSCAITSTSKGTQAVRIVSHPSLAKHMHLCIVITMLNRRVGFHIFGSSPANNQDLGGQCYVHGSWTHLCHLYIPAECNIYMYIDFHPYNIKPYPVLNLF